MLPVHVNGSVLHSVDPVAILHTDALDKMAGFLLAFQK